MTEALESEGPLLSSNEPKLFEPEDGVHDPVVFLYRGWIVDFFAIGNGLNKGLEILEGMFQHLLKLLLRGVFSLERDCP